MSRFILFVSCTLGCTLLAVLAGADDPPPKLTSEERKDLEAKWKELNAAGSKASREGKYPEAIKSDVAALELARRLYPKDEFPDGHNNVAISLNDLALVYKNLGNFTAAEPLYKEALAIRKRLFKGDHPHVATSLNNLAVLYKDQGKFAVAEPLYRDALDMRKSLFKGDHPDVAQSLNTLAVLYRTQGKYAAAEPLAKDALEMRQRLFKDDHADVAISLHNLASLFQAQGRYVEAEPLHKDGLEMLKRLFKGDHPFVATSMTYLAETYRAQGNYAAAEPRYRDVLEMSARLFKGDHPFVATSLNNLALAYHHQGKYTAAEPLYKNALEMQKRLFKGDQPTVASSLNNLASLYEDQRRFAEAELVHKDSLAMRQRLFKGDHPDVATSLNNLAVTHQAQRKYVVAESFCKDSLAMRQRLFKGDHADVASSLNNLATLYQTQGKYADAEPLYKDALEMKKRVLTGDRVEVAYSLQNLAELYRVQGKHEDARPFYKDALGLYRRLSQRSAMEKTEGETLTLVATFPPTIDFFLSNELAHQSDAAAVYPEVWFTKGVVGGVYEQRQLQARAVATDPKAANLLTELAAARRRRAELILAPATKDPGTLQKREEAIQAFDKKIVDLDRIIHPLLPAIERANKLAVALPTELQKVLPVDAAVVDFLLFIHYEPDNDKSGKAGSKRTVRYLAFVVTRDKVSWVVLETHAKIEFAVRAWREAIASGKEIPATIPVKVRELVWEKVRKELPANIKTVYVSPDTTLCRVPWGVLPGDNLGTILLEDFAIATIPRSQFLLDKFWSQDPLKNPPTQALVVGGVKYNVELAPPAGNSPALSGDPLLKPDVKLGWSFLPNTVGELNGVSAAAERKKLPTTRIEGDKATSPSILAALPRAKYAHFATHGFFADASFRSIFQLDEKDYETTRWGERIGRAVNRPLVMTGLVFAGANNPNTPGRGVLTGESLIDLDLSGLELAVLSACETGLGYVADGEGTFSLQRAFHLAGTRDVVASLWKVPDQSTAALMALFYRNLWDKNLSPMESLRQAQLEIYRNPTKIPELAKGFRGTFKEVPSATDVEIKPTKDGKAHPLLWAAFALSGPGR